MVDPLTIVAALSFMFAEPLPLPREVEFPFDDETRLLPGERNGGKVWRSHGLPTHGEAVPLVIFIHGVIFDGLRHHWLTEDPNGPWDARPFLGRMVDDGALPPLLAAAPSQIRDATDPGKLFNGLDYDALIDAIDRTIAPYQRVDRTRIVVVGHSGSACDPNSAAFAALRAKNVRVRALFAVDGCMQREGAEMLASTERVTDVIVSYQENIWPERPFHDFRGGWSHQLERTWPRGLRVLERHEPLSENAHLALVEITLRRWLPVVLPPIDRVSWTAAIARELPTLALPIDPAL